MAAFEKQPGSISDQLTQLGVADSISAENTRNISEHLGQVVLLFDDMAEIIEKLPDEIVLQLQGECKEANTLHEEALQTSDLKRLGDIKNRLSELRESIHQKSIEPTVAEGSDEADIAEFDSALLANSSQDTVRESLPAPESVVRQELSDPRLDTSSVSESNEDVAGTESVERERLIEYYHRWQQGDVTLMDKGWVRNLGKIHRDLGKMIDLAGYSQAESSDIYQTKLKPWVDRVAKKRRNKLQGISLEELRMEIITTMGNLLQGREIVEDRLSKMRSSGDGEAADSSFANADEFDSEQTVSSESVEVENALALERDRFSELSRRLKEDTSLYIKHHADIERAELLLRTVSEIQAETKYSAEKKLEKLDSNLRLLLRINNDIAASLGMVVSPEVDVTAPEAFAAEPIVDEEQLAKIRNLVDDASINEPSYLDLVENDALLKRGQFDAKGDPNNPDTWQLEPMSIPTLTDEITQGPIPTAEATPLPVAEADGEKVKNDKVAELRDRNPIKPIERGPAKSEVDSNPELADMWRQSRREFADIKLQRNNAYAAYYESEARSAMGKLRSLGKIFGINSELPKELQAVEAEYKAARKNHAEILSLMDRVKQRYDITVEPSKPTDPPEDISLREAKLQAGKRAFAQHFVVSDRMRQMKLQEQVIAKVDSEAVVVPAIKNIMAGLSKYKWHTRAAIILGVGTVGALTGGAAVGGLAALASGSRMAASIGTGALTGWLVREGMQDKVDQRANEKEDQISKIESGFSIDSLETLQDQMNEADDKYRRSIKQKDLLTVAAAGAAGFGAGMTTSFAMADALAGSEPVSTAEGSRVGATWDKLQELARLTEGQELLDVDDVFIPHIEQNGTVFGLRVEDISLRTSAEEVLDAADYPADEVARDIKLAIKDTLEAKPNLPKEEVARIALERVTRVYSDEMWWKQAQIIKIEIGDIEKIVKVPSILSPEELSNQAGAQDAGAGLSESGQAGSRIESDVMDSGSDPMNDNLVDEAAERSAGRYTVVSGDTLWKIVKTQYADALKDLSPSEQNRALDVLFDKVRATPELRDSIGLNPKAGGDIDKIWSGDNLNVNQLGQELQKIVDNPEDLKPHVQRGTLPVQADSNVGSVPIRFDRVPAGPEDFAAAVPTDEKLSGGFGPDYSDMPGARAEEVQTATIPEGYYDVPKPPVLAGPSGSYLQDPAYVSYLEKNGITNALLEKGTKTFVQNFEGKTYTVVDEVLRGYQSPFEKLSDMTIREVKELRAKFSAPDNQGNGIYKGVNMQALREYAQANNFKEETILAWSKQLERMAANPYLPFNENTTVRDWVSRDVAQKLIEEAYDRNFTGKV